MSYWLPSSERDILEAITNGSLIESQHLDVKLTYSVRKPGVNTDIAQDLAAFAVDGGAILVGIRQDGETLVAEPQPVGEIDELAERISQVTRDKPSPPIFAPTRVIRSETNVDKAYLLIEVPPSHSAPHSVDGVYWGRGDRANRRLIDDREVGRLIRARTNAERFAVDLLNAELAARAELPDGVSLYVVAEPTQAHDEEALLRLEPNDPGRHPHRGVEGGVWEVVLSSDGLPIRREDRNGRSLTERERFSGEDQLLAGSEISRSARGYSIGTGARTVRRNKLEILEHGGVRLSRQGLLRSRTLRARFNGEEAIELRILDDPGIVASVWRVIAVAIELGRRIGYRGSWSFALHVDGLHDVISSSAAQYVEDQLDLSRHATYDQPSYDRSTTAHIIELEQEPLQVLYRLVGRLVRGLRVDDLYMRQIEGWPGGEEP